MTAARLLGSLRLVVGAGSWLAPRTSLRAFGLADDGAVPPGAALTGRLFGVRDAALAAGALSPDPVLRRSALRAGIAIDAVDAVATALALRAGASRSAGPLVGLGAAAFCALGVLALREDQSS